MALLCPVFWFVLFSHQKRLFWKQLGWWWWQQIGQKELIKSGKILFYIHKQQPKTQQLKQEWFTATVLLIYRSCFWLPSLLFYFFYLFILTVSVWKHTGELQGFLLEQQRGFSWQNAVLQDLSHPTSHTVGPARWCRTCWCVLHSPWEIVDPNPVLVNHNTSRHHPQEDLCVALVLKVQGGIIDLE